MPSTRIVLLRGINVGGNKMVAMAALRALCEKLGFGNPQTLLQSGNLVFQCADRKPETLEQQLEREIEKRLKVQCSVLVRTVKEWDRLIERNPFVAEAAKDPARLIAYCLKSPAVRGAGEALRAAIAGAERVEVDGRHAYLWYPEGIGRSKVTPGLVEKKLGTIATGRNWNTVRKLAALAKVIPGV